MGNHISTAVVGPPHISSDYLVKEAEDEMDFADALTMVMGNPIWDRGPLLEVAACNVTIPSMTMYYNMYNKLYIDKIWYLNVCMR
jgi:hypothetical protein